MCGGLMHKAIYRLSLRAFLPASCCSSGLWTALNPVSWSPNVMKQKLMPQAILQIRLSSEVIKTGWSTTNHSMSSIQMRFLCFQGQLYMWEEELKRENRGSWRGFCSQGLRRKWKSVNVSGMTRNYMKRE